MNGLDIAFGLNFQLVKELSSLTLKTVNFMLTVELEVSEGLRQQDQRKMDLLQTGKFGVLTNQQLLGTTSNNITNVNTDGYVRQHTYVYTSAVDWGIGSVVTRRLYDKYAQREMFRDQGNVGFYDAYASGLNTVDSLLSKDDTSIATSIDSFFSSMQSAVQNTTSVANRRELLTQLQNMVDRYHSLNYNINNELNDVNNQISDTATTINSLVESIYNINRQVRSLVGEKGEQTDVALQLMDERDRLINQLSEYVDINLTTEPDGSYSLYLGNGQLLVNGDTYATLNVVKNPFDTTQRQISLTFQDAKKTTLTLGNDCWGGRLGGYLNAADEIRQSKRDLGQLALAFADALNEQNKGGITLENKAGTDLISMPSVAAKSNNLNYGMTVTFDDGEGSDLRNCDYEVRFNSEGEVEVYTTYGDGKYTQVDPDLVKQVSQDGENLVIEIEGHGITMSFNATKENMATQNNLKFYAQPTVDAAYNISCNITKPEEFAFASAIRVNTNKHAGNAVASLVGVTQTGEGMGIQYDPETKLPAFAKDADGNVTAPNYVQYIEDGPDGPGYYSFALNPDDFNEDGSPKENVIDVDNAIGFAKADCNGENIFAHTTWTDPALQNTGYPGYDVSFIGTVVNGSGFQIEINENGSNDNSNGNLLAQLQQENLVSSRTSENNKVGFTESYSDLVATVGSAVLSATTDLAAAQAKCTQSQNLFASVAGVNLDEEAANLVRYQQSYAACSKIINASQTVFDTLLSAM